MESILDIEKELRYTNGKLALHKVPKEVMSEKQIRRVTKTSWN